MSMKLSVDFNHIDSLASLIGDIDSVCSPVLDKRSPEQKLKAVQTIVSEAHEVIERMLGQYADLVYRPETLMPETLMPEIAQVAA